jgi:hypothetical protein
MKSWVRACVCVCARSLCVCVIIGYQSHYSPLQPLTLIHPFTLTHTHAGLSDSEDEAPALHPYARKDKKSTRSREGGAQVWIRDDAELMDSTVVHKITSMDPEQRVRNRYGYINAYVCVCVCV